MSSLRGSLIGIVVLTIAGLVYTFVAGNEPLLGLDLQGGVSVVLQPTEEATGEELDQSIEVMRRRVDAIGVAEPEITRQGDTILVQLPGVDDQQRALELVGQTAELRFRPVVGCVADGVEAVTAPELDDPDAIVVLPGRPDETGCDVVQANYRLGPSLLTGDALSTADGVSQGLEWVVAPTFRSGADGIDLFNAAAARCYVGAPDPLVCPSGRLAIVLDGTVIVAPSINEPTFGGDAIVISGGFDQEEAQDVALVLRFGALPIELETQQVQTVSATLGRDSLQAGAIAGLVGLGLVALYMGWAYRLLGLVAVLSLAVSFGLLWTMISWLGESQGLALTLAGVTGLVVSIGVSVDSNVVYFEDLKEDVGAGRPLFSAVDLSFGRAFSTIVKADVASLIGAVVLYVLTVGPVKGFALYLGLATVLDLVASYFFMRPAVMLLGRSGLAERNPAMVGVRPWARWSRAVRPAWSMPEWTFRLRPERTRHEVPQAALRRRSQLQLRFGLETGRDHSAVLFLIAIGSLLAAGPRARHRLRRWRGLLEVPAETASIESARDALRDFGLANARIQEVTDGTGDRLLRVRAGIDSIDDSPEIAIALADLAGVDVNEVNIQTVGPSWGDEITAEARNALDLVLPADRGLHHRAARVEDGRRRPGGGPP